MSNFAEKFETYNPKDKKNRGQDLSTVEQIQELAAKPTSLVIAILLCVIIGMTLQFGQIQSQIASMNKQLGKEKSSESALESKFNNMQKDVKTIKEDDAVLQARTAGLEAKEVILVDKEEKMKKRMEQLESTKNDDPWGQGEDFENNQPLKKDEEKPFPGSFAEFMNNMFKGIDEEKAVNESPSEKKENNATDNFFDFPPMPNIFGPTGPVEHPHTSLNDLFQNINKPGAHPKFVVKGSAQGDSESSEPSSPVQELKATNGKPELTEADKASGIVTDFHNAPVHHAAPVAPPVIEAPKVSFINQRAPAAI